MPGHKFGNAKTRICGCVSHVGTLVRFPIFWILTEKGRKANEQCKKSQKKSISIQYNIINIVIDSIHT